ncbi:MAG TPA: HlyD family efflux transporter periplasmic adaptor subunit, partial [Candidatus Caenarcaniphilales bacterium]
RAQVVAIAQAKTNAATTQKLLAQLQTEAAAQKARLERLKPLVEEGVIARERIFEVEQDLRNSQSNIIKNQGEFQQNLTESQRLTAGLAQKQAEGQTTQLEAAQQTQQLEVEMSQLKARIAETQNLLNSARAKLKQSYLTSPVNGVVLSLNIRNIGEVVQPGQTVAEIAPHNAPLILSAILPNREAGFVKPGMPVQVKFDAYPYQDHGVVPGKVTSISSDAKPDERLGAVYRVEVALARNALTTNQQTIPFKAGQTATAEIIIRRRRVAEILFDPIRQLQKGGLSL